MPDDNEQLDEHERQHAADQETEEPDAASEADPGDLGVDADGPDDYEAMTAREGLGALNSRIIGTVTLHYPQRDVQVTLDGASALRLLTLFARRRRDGLEDLLDPEQSALAGWVVLDPEEVMAMSWLPSLGRSPRVAIDPPMPATA